jgi:hypothetical protein
VGSHHPLDDLGDLQVRVDGHLDAREVALSLEVAQEVPEVGIGHADDSPSTVPLVLIEGV